MTAKTSESVELERLRATIDITNSLLAAISSLDPVNDLASRLSVLCHGTAVIYDADGRIVASTGVAPTQLIWNEVSATNRSEVTLEIGRWHVLSRRVALRDGIHTIAIASHGEDRVEQIGHLLLDTAERLLGAVHGIRYGSVRRDRRDNEQLLASLHDGILPSREHRFWNRLTQFEFAAYTPLRAIEVAPLDQSSARQSQVEQLASSARAANVPLLVMLYRPDRDAPATIAGLVPDSPNSERWLTIMSVSHLIGVSSPLDTLTRIPEAVREAETGLDIGRRWVAAAADPARIGPIRIDDIDLATWALSHVNAKQLSERISRTLDPINDDTLRETLVTYLATDQHIGRAAEALYVHPNTVRYRLGRIEAAIGLPISSAPAIANLVLALRPEIAAAQLRLSTSMPSVTPDMSGVH